MDVQPPQSSLPSFPADNSHRPTADERLVRYVPNRPPVARPPSLTVEDIYYILFRQKRKIIICAAVGFAIALGLYLSRPVAYESEAKLFIRYILEGKSPTAVGSGSDMKSPDQRGETIINSECEILSSYDLAQQVADIIGPERILAKSNYFNARLAAGVAVSKALLVEVPMRSSVIRIVYQNPNPELVQPVLQQVIDSYLKQHIQIHQASGVSDDFLMQQVDQLRTRLAQTEQELRAARKTAGVSSLEESKRMYSEQLSRIRQEIFAAEAELAEWQAALKEILKQASSADSPATNSPLRVSEMTEGQRQEYRGLSARLEGLWKRRQELLSQFTEENDLVKSVREQIAEAEKLKLKLEQSYPELHAVNTMPAQRQPEQPRRSALDPTPELARITALESRIKVLKSQQNQLQTEIATLDSSEAVIIELQRKKELQEANYRHFSASLEQSRFDEAIGSGKVSNISVVQHPSPPVKAQSKTIKLMAGAIFGGLFLGLALAFLIELKLDHTLRRPGEIETKLRLPVFVSIPFMDAKKMHQPSAGVAKTTAGTGADPASQLEVIPLDGGAALRPFHELLRDRLISDFEAKNLTHKPKLIAVTSPGKRAGVSTTAVGLAASLSETGDGNVLLVDMNPQQGTAQQFYRGKPMCRLDDALSEKQRALVQENLYVVAEGSNRDTLVGGMPKRFSQLVPKLKASNYDYIIFDMPPISQTSMTPRLAKFMDTVLLLIESEQTDEKHAQQASALLAESKANVCAVLNKTRPYVPAMLHQEFLSEG